MTSSRRLIVVLGAGGRQANHVIRSLLEHADQWLVRGVTNDLRAVSIQDLLEKNVNLVQCDLNNQEECARVFENAYGVFAVTNYWEAKPIGEYQQAINIIEAAKEAHVKHFIFSIFPDLDQPHEVTDDPDNHARYETRIERYLRELRSSSAFASTTMIQVGYYYQNLISCFVPDTEPSEFRYLQLPHVRIPFYDARDTGKIILECLQDPDKWSNGPVIPVVSEQLTMDDVCSQIQRFSNKEIKFIPLSYEQALRKLNPYVMNSLRWYSMFASADEHQVEKTAEICPRMRKLRDWIEEINRLLQ